MYIMAAKGKTFYYIKTDRAAGLLSLRQEGPAIWL